MIILDTNVLSALIMERVDPAVVTWLDRQPWESVWTSSISILEIRFGLETMADGRRRSARLFEFGRLVDEDLGERIAVFDRSAAEAAAELMARRKKAGRPREMRDTMIAGIAISRRAELATRNVRDFADAGIQIINPWQGRGA
jgi:predicted nucleic acid-binding protein